MRWQTRIVADAVEAAGAVSDLHREWVREWDRREHWRVRIDRYREAHPESVPERRQLVLPDGRIEERVYLAGRLVEIVRFAVPRRPRWWAA